MRARHALGLVIAGVALACGSATPGYAQSGSEPTAEAAAPPRAFGSTQTLSPGRFDAQQSQVAVDQAGRAVFVWTFAFSSFGGCAGDIVICSVQTRARNPDGSLSPVQTLSAEGDLHAFAPRVAVDKRGNAVIAWMARDGKGQCEGGFSDCLRIQARRRSSSGILSAIQTLSPAGSHAYDPHVAMDSEGRAFVVWGRAQKSCGGSCFRIEARVLPASGVPGAIETLSPNGQQPRVAATAGGRAVFTWIDNKTSGYLVKARARSASGQWSPAQAVSGASGGFGAFIGDTDEHTLAVDREGRTVVVWTGSDPAINCDGLRCRIIQTRTLSAGGSLSPIQNISSPGAAFDPGVGAGNGNAVFVWYQQDSTLNCGGGQNGCFRVRARTRTAGGALGQVLTLSTPGQHATQPQVAMDERGNALSIWQRQFPTVGSECGDGCLRIQSRSLSRANVLGPLETISAGPGAAGSPVVAVDPDGGTNPNAADAIAAWSRADSTRETCCFRIQTRSTAAH